VPSGEVFSEGASLIFAEFFPHFLVGLIVDDLAPLDGLHCVACPFGPVSEASAVPTAPLIMITYFGPASLVSTLFSNPSVR